MRSEACSGSDAAQASTAISIFFRTRPADSEVGHRLGPFGDGNGFLVARVSTSVMADGEVLATKKGIGDRIGSPGKA